MPKPKANPKLVYLSLGTILTVVAVLIVLTFLIKFPPFGAEIVNKPLPDDHNTTECYRCHKGIPAGMQLSGTEVPSTHPVTGCVDCHEGYTEAAPSAQDPVDSSPPQ